MVGHLLDDDLHHCLLLNVEQHQLLLRQRHSSTLLQEETHDMRTRITENSLLTLATFWEVLMRLGRLKLEVRRSSNTVRKYR